MLNTKVVTLSATNQEAMKQVHNQQKIITEKEQSISTKEH